MFTFTNALFVLASGAAEALLNFYVVAGHSFIERGHHQHGTALPVEQVQCCLHALPDAHEVAHAARSSIPRRVSTSNAAFVGPAAMGPLFKPTLLTNFDQFSALFGGYVEDPYRVYVTHAVKGFFDEGGSVCYFVRVGQGVQATLNLLDGKGRSVLVVTALNEGVAGNNIKVQLKASAAPLASTKAAFVKVNIPAGNAAPDQRTVKTASDTDAAKFKPGDVVFLGGGGDSERATIASITKDAAAPSSTFTMVSNLSRIMAREPCGSPTSFPDRTRSGWNGRRARTAQLHHGEAGRSDGECGCSRRRPDWQLHQPG